MAEYIASQKLKGVNVRSSMEKLPMGKLRRDLAHTCEVVSYKQQHRQSVAPKYEQP